MSDGIVRAAVNDGRSIRVYFVDDKIPPQYEALFENYGKATLDQIIAPYVVVTCRNKALARQCVQYALKLDNWDTHETINWAQNDEPLYLRCDALARKYQGKPDRACFHIKNAIIGSGILVGTGVRVTRVDWQGVANVFLASV